MMCDAERWSWRKNKFTTCTVHCTLYPTQEYMYYII